MRIKRNWIVLGDDLNKYALTTLQLALNVQNLLLLFQWTFYEFNQTVVDHGYDGSCDL